MPDDISVKIGMQGEREFKQALSDINNGLKVTASELALVTAKFSQNSQSVTALTAKGEVLNKQIGQQNDKITKLNEALGKAKEHFDDNDSRTLAWQTSLNLAEAELMKLKDELSKNNEALAKATEELNRNDEAIANSTEELQDLGNKEEEVSEQTKGVGSVISDLAGKLGIHLPSGADKAVKALDNTKLSTAALVGAVAALVTGMAKTTIETAKTADEIMTMSKVTGMSTDTIQKMNYASELLDVSTETISGSMKKMVRSMDDARNGGGEAADAFKKLHLSVTDSNGQLKDSEQMFYEVVDALGKVKNETERDALSMQIFGRTAQDLNPVIQSGSKAFKELGTEAEKMGYIMDGNALNSLGQLDDAMKRFENQTQAFKNSIAMAMLPMLSSLFEILNKVDPKIIATVAIIGGMATVAITVIKTIKDVTETLKALKPATDVASAAAGGFNANAMRTTAIVIGVVAALIALAAIIAVITGRSSELNATMSNIGNSVGNITNTVNGVQRPQYAYVNGSHANGLDYVPFDGYIAELHRGERVQRASENPYNGGSGGGDTFILQVNMAEVDEVYKLVEVTKRLKQTMRAGKVKK